MKRTWAIRMAIVWACAAISTAGGAGEPDITLTCKPDASGYRTNLVRIYLQDRQIEIDGKIAPIVDIQSDKIVTGELVGPKTMNGMGWTDVWTIYRATLRFSRVGHSDWGKENSFDGQCAKASLEF